MTTLDELIVENSLRAEVRYVNFDRQSDAQNYLTAARRLCSGVEALAKGTGATGLAYSFLAAHALECALKAYLSGIGFTINRLTHAPLGHDLENLWIEAATRGLTIPARPPHWCSILNQEHGVEFAFRQPAGLHGSQLPALIAMALNLAEIVSVIGKTVWPNTPNTDSRARKTITSNHRVPPPIPRLPRST